MKAIQQDILNTRPDVEATWIIFNAPRPIYGHSDWKGDFSHGVFYAAVDPAGDHATEYIESNVRLDAQVCRFITAEDMKDWAIKFCTENGYDFNELDETDIRCSYFSETGRREIEL